MTIQPDSATELLVVIPTLNEASHIRPLVEQLVRASEQLPMLIVVSDGGSTDGTVEAVKAMMEHTPNLRYLHNPKTLQSAAINLAVQQFGQDHTYLIRIDAHAAYPDDYCQILMNEAKTQQADSIVVPMITVGQKGFQRAVAAAQNSLMGNGGSAHRMAPGAGQWVEHGHHALMRIEIFRSVGGYDETFSHNEDAELDLRLLKGGFRIWLTGRTAVTYYPRSTAEALFRQYRSYGSGRARTLLKHKIKPKLRQALPVGIVPAIALAALFPLGGIFMLPALCWLIGCLGYGLYLGYKEQDNDIMYGAGFAAIIMHFAWSIGFWGMVIADYRDRKAKASS
jgi:succinoglycan biosynthesis protein ExoA